MSASIAWSLENGQLVFKGELTRATVPQVWSARGQWQADSEERLVVDLAAVEHVDSAGVAMLLQLKRLLAAQQRELSLTQPSQQFKAIADVSGATELLNL